MFKNFLSLEFTTLLIPAPPVYEMGEGAKYAQALAKTSQVLSIWFTFISWVIIIISTIYIYHFTNFEIVDGAFQIIFSNKYDFLPLLASTIAFRIGLALRDRAIAASQLSSLSHEALKLVTDRNEEKGDKDAYHAALEAKAKWLEGRMTPEQLNLLTQKVETLLQKQT